MNQQRQDGEGGGGAFSLDRAMSAVRRRLRIVIAMPIAAAVLTSAVMLWLPDRFDASAIVQIDPRKKTISNLEGVLSELKADTATVESEVEIIRSRAIALSVINILKLRDDPDFSRPSLTSRILAATGLREPELPEPIPSAAELGPSVNNDPMTGLLGPDEPGQTRPARDEVAVAFSERLKVTRVRNTLLIDIRFSASDAVKAARIANTIAEVYLTEQLKAKQDVAGHASRLLEKKLWSLRKEVSTAEQRIAQFKNENNIFESEGQILGEKQLARLMEQTVAARNATAEARARYELVQRLATNGDSGAGIADVLQSHTVRLLKEQLAKATGREAELSTRYGPKHPEMQKVRAEVREAHAQVDAEIERLVTNLKNEYEVAAGREKELGQSLDSLKSEDATSKEASVRLKELNREAETSRALYEALLARYKQTVETQSLQLPDARIVEQADAPLFPAAPKRKQFVVIATFGGIGLGIGIALLLEFMTLGIGRPEDVERVFELAHLASLPESASGHGGRDELHDIRLMVASPSSSFAESIRALRREVDVRRTSDAPRVIQVTASLPNEGATMVASNLAHHYAMTGARVLLVDADLRRAHLTRQLAVTRQAGLAEAITRGVPVENAILFDVSTGLHFLPASGAAPSHRSPPELLAAVDTRALLARLKAQFDVIILDAPPLLPIIDSRIIGDYADQIVFVMAWRRTSKQIARRALTSLGFNQNKLVGVVVTRVDSDVLSDEGGIGSAVASPVRGDMLERAA
ncbi:MAG: AAA family ATPase [Hyphomicrobiaceae bacterium]|nr:AAA family ATPase [Hyphomicrobiaceae bacterium]